jgi:serine/threonine protein kinase
VEDGVQLPATPTTHTSGVGTESYAAPEQLRGGMLTARSDVFSLGVLLFELLCPFETGMERATRFEELKRGTLPSALVKEYPKEVCRFHCAFMVQSYFALLFIPLLYTVKLGTYRLTRAERVYPLDDCPRARRPPDGARHP